MRVPSTRMTDVCCDRCFAVVPGLDPGTHEYHMSVEVVFPMAPSKNPPIADIDEDPNVEVRPYSSPPCYAAEVDPGYFGMPHRPDLEGLRLLARRIDEARDALEEALSRLASR